MITRKGLLGLCFILILANQSYAKKYYGQANDLLTYGAGGRALSMGGAYSALSDDASAPYWNPAGLDRLTSHQVMFMHTAFFESTSYDYFGSVHPFRRMGAVGLAFLNLRSGGFEKTSAVGESLGNGSISHSVLYGSYAKSLWGVSLGTNLKVIREDNLDTSGTGFGLDLGALAGLGSLHESLKPVSLAVVLGNALKPKVTLKNSANTYETNLRTGLALKLLSDKMIATIDFNKLKDESSYFTTGMEINPWKFLSLRFGYNQIPNLTYGLGFHWGSYHLDYGLNDHDLGLVHKVSLSYFWGNVYKAEAKAKSSNKWGKSQDIILEGLSNTISFAISVPNMAVRDWQLVIRQDDHIIKTFQGFSRPPEELPWDVHDEMGQPVSAGSYLYEWTIVYEDGQLWRSRGKLTLKEKPQTTELDIDAIMH